MTNLERDTRYDVVWDGHLAPRVPCVPREVALREVWVREFWGTPDADHGAIARTVEVVIAERPMTMSDVRERTGLSFRQIASAIQRLRRTGRLIVEEQRRQARGRPRAVYTVQAA